MSDDTFTVEFTKEELFITMIAVSLFKPVSIEGPVVKDALLEKLADEWDADPEVKVDYAEDKETASQLEWQLSRENAPKPQPYRPFMDDPRVGPMNPPRPTVACKDTCGEFCMGLPDCQRSESTHVHIVSQSPPEEVLCMPCHDPDCELCGIGECHDPKCEPEKRPEIYVTLGMHPQVPCHDPECTICAGHPIAVHASKAEVDPAMVPHRYEKGEAPKRCETFGCHGPGTQMYAIGPATNVWLCAACLTVAEEENHAT